MASTARGNAAAAAKRIYYHSAIGTHRLQPRPLKNILYPYYRQYKPVYRARNARTPGYYWPEIDKYPWHSHQKRFPKVTEMSIELFSEFARRNPAVRTLFETLHPLPQHGVNCLVWKTEKKGKLMETQSHVTLQNEQKSTSQHSGDSEEHQRVIKIKDCYYMVDKCVRNNAMYLIKHVDYKLRPFKAKVVSDFYMDGRLVRQNVSPIGSIRGEWRWSAPFKISCEGHLDTTSTLTLGGQDSILHRKDFIEFTYATKTPNE